MITLYQSSAGTYDNINKKLAISLFKSTNSAKNQNKNISVVLPSSSINIWGKSVTGFMSYDRTNIQRLQLYI